MKIVCASSVLSGKDAFSTLGETVLLPEEHITREQLHDADVLITRSKTRITRELLENTPVRFVGCAVAGTDHMDRAWLDTTDIAWCHAPGCNANSVAEYVVAALLLVAQRHHLAVREQTLGVIGVGHIGTRVVEKASELGFTVLQNDPPREAALDTPYHTFMPLEDVLALSDLVSLHVPLTSTGPYATRNMVNHRFLETMKPGAFLFNTARGEILDSDALLTAMEYGIVRQSVLDVWEDEPAIRKEVLDAVDLGTPHIAGYSYEGRLNGTRMVYEELCHYLEEIPTWSTDGDDTGPVSPSPEQVVDAQDLTDQEALSRMVRLAHPLADTDRIFRTGASDQPEVMAKHFVESRRAYPERHEFSAARFQLLHASESLLTTAWELGFQITE